MSLRSGAVLLVTTATFALGFAGPAYALTTPSISTSQLPGSAVVGSPIADRATLGGGSATYTCPPQDQLGFALGASNTASNPIFCSYPAFPNEDPKDFYCEYNATTGALTTDHDAGLCPATAVAPVAIPTGNVTFRLYNNNAASGLPLFTDTENLVNGVATSAAFTAPAIGTDYWVATYNGDSNYNPVTSSTGGEPVTITPASPTLTGSGGGSATVGTPISDSASIGGGYLPHGSVSFALFPGSACTGTQVGSTTSVSVSGAKTYPSGSIATPASAGAYSVLVSYAPDANNKAPPKVCDRYTANAQPMSLTGLSQSHRRWRLGNKPAGLSAASNPPIGTTFQFTLNQAATVRFSFARCVSRAPRRNRRHKACAHTVPSGALSFSAGAGPRKLSFQGRVTRKKKLTPGSYRLTITATNAAKQQATGTLSFVIVPG